jgi:RecB family exonuclease
MIEKLPPPETEVSVPSMFAVTSVANAGGCLLKLVTSGSEWRHKRLPRGPEAIVGSLLHRVSERWMKGDGVGRPDEIFDDELSRFNAELATRRDAQFVPIEKTRSPLEWIIMRREAIARCKALPRAVRYIAEGSLSERHRAFGAEIWLEAPSLGLKGKADEVVDTGTQIVIRDYKTGSVHGPSGALKPSIILQLRLYGLIAALSYPGRRIALEVDALDVRTVVDWDDNVRNETERDWLETRRRLEGESVVPGAVASPGACCRFCRIRHRCDAYLSTAPSWWSDSHHRDECPPLDTWGKVNSVEHRRGRATISLTDAAGRSVRITDLDAAVRTWHPGEVAYFFGLERSGRSSGWGATTNHPQDFHEFPPDRSARRAWGLACFV